MVPFFLLGLAANQCLSVFEYGNDTVLCQGNIVAISLQISN